MTDRERFELREIKENRYVQIRGKCEVCGSLMSLHGAQMAHRIRQSKRNIGQYSSKIIHDPINWKLVCSLKCNAKVDISFNPEKVQEILKAIKEA